MRVLIGTGSGGGTAAHAAAALGKKVAVVEKDVIGGECPNYACVPTKALLHAADLFAHMRQARDYGIKTSSVSVDYKKVHRWKDLVVSRTGAARGDAVFKDDRIRVIQGHARFTGSHEIRVGDRRYTARFFLIATGSSPFIPPIRGLEQSGYLTFKEAGDLKELPKSVFILGGGAVGCEFTQIFASFGTTVHLADTAPRLLMKEDVEVSELVAAMFVEQKVRLHLKSEVTHVVKRNGKKVVYFETDGQESTVSVDEILIMTGKKPNLDLDLERIGVACDKRGIKVNRFMQTTLPHIYASGDVVGPYLYTHTAYYQSYIAAENMFTRKKTAASYTVVPRCVFVQPEVASVGLTETEAREQGIKIKKGLAPIAVLGRANTDNALNGFVKVLTKRNGTLIGASIVAPRAGELIHELALAIKLHAKAQDVAEMIHAYPTYSEAIKIACSDVV